MEIFVLASKNIGHLQELRIGEEPYRVLSTAWLLRRAWTPAAMLVFDRGIL
jgi:hypothetical protein